MSSQIKKFLALLVFISLPTLMLAACQSNSSEGETTDSSEQASNDQTLTLAFAPGSEPADGFDPTSGGSHWGSYGVQLFQSSLLKRNKDLTIAPDLATDYDISDDGLTWTFNLREDVKFSDGEPLTAKDVVYTYEQAQNEESLVNLDHLESVEQDGDYRVIFHLKEPRSTFADTAVSLGIVPQHLHDENYAWHPVGSGPLKLVEYQDGEQLIMEPNELYYGDPIQFDQINVVWMEEDAAHAAALAGQVDMAHIPSTMADQEHEGLEQVNLKSIDNRGLAYVMAPDEGKTTEEGYPIGNDVTSDYSIRQAIDLALDRQAMIDGIAKGYARPATSVADNMPWWNEELEGVIDDYNQPDKAIQVLEDNGWKVGDDGIREKDGVRASFELIYNAGDQVREAIAITTRDQLKEIGIEVKPVGLSWDEAEKQMHSTPLVMGWGGYDPLETYKLYHSDLQGVDYYNTGFYSNPQVDEYLDQALRATDLEDSYDYFKKAHWDGQTGFSSYGDIAWSWIMNIDHLYLKDEKLEIGDPIIQPHGRGWALLANLDEWHWTE